MFNITNWINRVWDYIVDTSRKIYIRFYLLRDEFYDIIKDYNKK